ncbi:dienelactone hydrolase family protein [Curtobacterium sp. Leaf261]|uniref:dienelactone hydrolase family protein n=1 Tax=Curtobacterium sp. Leaf261 TaxID=1736311 RepID=UPI0006F5900E|nr:dienelactone hydrolase family protein [Curtobacterium sp. Leaf261]KQO62224.1 dienelactone hydrolase [Curtobacterium sp. Leaf261]
MAGQPGSAPTSTLDGWAVSPFTGGGLTHDCYEKGSGPGVVLIPEVPGITPEVLGLADHLVDAGFTVVVPSPFGEPGRPASAGYAIRVVSRLCVQAEFRAFAANASRPITAFLRTVAADLAARTPGSGVGVIGMCFTGGFALAAAVDDSVRASVLSQPGVPFPLGAARRADPAMSAAEFDRVAARADAGHVCAIGLRFSQDGVVPPERFAAIRDKLGDAFEVIELDSAPGNTTGFPKGAHSVLTGEVRDVPGHPALAARERVVAFLHERLTPDA